MHACLIDAPVSYYIASYPCSRYGQLPKADDFLPLCFIQKWMFLCVCLKIIQLWMIYAQ